MSIKIFELSNKFWSLTIKEMDENYTYILFDRINEVSYADLDYHYSIVTSKKRGSRFEYLDILDKETKAKKLVSRTIEMQNKDTLIIRGKFQDTEIELEQIFKLEKNEKWLKEYITLTNKGKKRVRFGLINFGFEKIFFKQHQGWQDHLDEFFLTPIPTRRYHHYGFDRRKESFSANDLLFNSWVLKEAKMPGFCAEGWLWGCQNGGLLVCKYNQTQIEFSRFDKFLYPLPGRGVNDVSIIFGGVSLCNGDPELGTELKPNQSYTFGVSKYAGYRGDYKEGYYLYRDHLDQCGHRFKADYNPPVHWNELYNLGWEAEKTGFFVEEEEYERYTLEKLLGEAELAKEVGAECLYLDPGWNTYLGSEIWDEEQFGPLKDFSRTIHEKYGLKLALHLMMNFGSEHEKDYFYLISKTGVRVAADPYINLYCVCANDKWVKEKSRRILELAKHNIDFFMFDFTDFSMFMFDNIGCFNKEHGHEVPMRRQSHTEGIFKVIQNVKKEYPNILIEAHQRGVEHPCYYQHALPHCHDENWGFECMWNPLEDLLSHKAFQLFEYNMTYSIPLYLHINENSDNENMLQFWWYASVVRHLGIGGLKDRNSEKFIALKQAMSLYMRIKSILTHGTFYGIDPTTHFHLSEKMDKAVLIATNLSSRSETKSIILEETKYGINFQSIKVFDGKNNNIDADKYNFTRKMERTLKITIEIPPLSPRIVILE